MQNNLTRLWCPIQIWFRFTVNCLSSKVEGLERARLWLSTLMRPPLQLLLLVLLS